MRGGVNGMRCHPWFPKCWCAVVITVLRANIVAHCSVEDSLIGCSCGGHADTPAAVAVIALINYHNHIIIMQTVFPVLASILQTLTDTNHLFGVICTGKYALCFCVGAI